jgi:hypothetical protein
MPIIQRHKKTFDNSNNWLLNFASNVTSQCGEDGIILKIFELIGVDSAVCVEFGAWDGRLHSNTHNLIENYGWKAVLIEGDPDRFNQLELHCESNANVISLCRMVGFDPPDSLDDILSETGIPKQFDLLSVDIDGNDYHVWDALVKFTPRVVVIEFNPTIPNDVIYVQDRDMNVRQGSSLLALIELGKKKGYDLISVSGWNAIFVQHEYFSLFKMRNNSADVMFDDQTYATKVFQLFDGRLEMVGQDCLMWSGIKFSSEDIQILPAEQRVYSDKE